MKLWSISRYPTGKLLAEYKLRQNRFPDISVKVHPVLFLVVGLAPAHDGADLAAHELRSSGGDQLLAIPLAKMDAKKGG
jgi:hypothetical protein